MNDELKLQSLSDHDLLLIVHTKMEGIGKTLDELADDTKERLTRLEEKKLDKQEFTDYVSDYKLDKQDKEGRLRFVERYGWAAIGGLYVIVMIIGWYLLIHYGK